MNKNQARWQVLGCSQTEELSVDVDGKTIATAYVSRFTPSRWRASVGEARLSGESESIGAARRDAQAAIKATLEVALEAMTAVVFERQSFE